jgi:lipoprotein-anchoring transpeptidase ErfK/SrfK
MKKFFGYKTLFIIAAVIIVALTGLKMWGPSLLRPTSFSISSATMTETPRQLLPVATTSNTGSQPQVYVFPPTPTSTPQSESSTAPGPRLYQYIEVVDGCGPYYEGDCVNMRSGPGTEYPVISQLRNGVVLKVTSSVEREGHTWYKIGFDGGVRYPERVTSDWYVAGDYVQLFMDEGERTIATGINQSSTKRIVVDLAKERLYAYDGDTLFMDAPISTGLEFTPTLPGTFSVYRKMPSSYMQGPVPGVSDQYYDLPGVPWDLYFTYDGNAIHGAYWHNNFGQPWSHGCVNLPLDQAHQLYLWADLGTPVTVVND